jgi:DNA-binding CsgD family transcriptional regulator
VYTEAPQGRDSQTGSAARCTVGGRTLPSVPRRARAALAPRAALAILDRLHHTVIVTDEHGAPLFCNAAANTMLMQGDPIAVAAGSLLLRSRGAQAAIDGYFAHTSPGPDMPTDTLALRLERRDGQPACRLLVMRLGDALGGTDPVATLFAIFVYAPQAGRCIPVRVLTDLYGLSPAEARLTSELYRGHALEAAGNRLGIAISTARTHLKRIFEKCEVRSQAELLQLLALGPTRI